MRRRALISILAIGLFCLLAGLLAVRIATKPRNADAIELALQALVINRHDYGKSGEAMADLLRLGDGVMPRLEHALAEQDSKTDLVLARLRGRLPSQLAQFVPDRPSKTELRSAVGASLYRFGPAVCRALARGIGPALEDCQDLSGMEVLRSLYWSIPESPEAIGALSNWLAHPKPGKPLFGMADSREIWPAVPHLAPLLGPWLEYADTARDAAEGLGLMGTNALYALPLLVRTARDGCSGGPGNVRFHVHYAGEMQAQILQGNRGAALEAIARLGRVTPEVEALFREGLADGSAYVRAASANALGMLGSKAAPLLPFLLDRLDRENATVLRYQLEAIGNIGPEARPSLPVLRAFVGAAGEAVPEGAPLGRVVRWHFEALPVPQAAALAIAQIDPASMDAAALDRLAPALCALATIPASNVVQLRPLAAALGPRLEPSLASDAPWIRLGAAFHLLLLDPQNENALRVLRGSMRQGDPAVRSIAALKYFAATGESEAALATMRETLRSVVNLNTQSPLNTLREFGATARHLAPQVQPLLSDPDSTLRMLAGKTLRSIAPEAMPALGEAR